MKTRLQQILEPCSIPERMLIIGALVTVQSDGDHFRKAFGTVSLKALDELLGSTHQYDEHVLRFRGYQRAFMAREYRMAGEAV